MSKMLTSADIQDGKVEIDRVTKAKTTYKVIDGGYEVITETPVEGGIKTEKRTFWDPKPVTEEDMIKEEELKRKIKSRYNREIRIDQNTTMLTREIEGGYEEVFTTTNADGTKSSKTKTHYFSVPADQLPAVGHKPNADKPKKKALLKKSSMDSIDSVESRQVVKQQSVQDSHNNYHENTTIEQSSRITQHTEISENNRTIRKNSVQEQSVRATQSSNTADGKKLKKKTKSNIPPPPPDFIQNDTTTIKSKRVPGGMEYIYSTELESGQTITTSKTVYEEEEHELTEQEIKEYKKTLKDAEKHKNITQAKKLKSPSGTKKVVPSENPGEVTTVETIEIEGGTEYHYTTVTADGVVKKSVKTVYDPIENEEEEQEIIEDYEEEIIEPGEKTYKTIESIKHLPKKFEEQVTTITTEKKERKVKKSMMISN